MHSMLQTLETAVAALYSADLGSLDRRSIGEVLSLSTFLETLEIDGQDCFFDLGSGRGQIVLAAALRGARACGVEIAQTRHEMAQEATARLVPGIRDRVSFILGDALEADATVVFINNVLFDASLNAAFLRRMDCRYAPRLRLVACGAPLADPVTAAKALRAVHLDCPDCLTIDEATYAGQRQHVPLYVYRRLSSHRL